MADDTGDDGRMRERVCVHREGGAEGAYYRGEEYVAALKRLRGRDAMRVAGRVGSLFWSDAPRVSVWLCRACAVEAGLRSPG